MYDEVIADYLSPQRSVDYANLTLSRLCVLYIKDAGTYYAKGGDPNGLARSRCLLPGRVRADVDCFHSDCAFGSGAVAAARVSTNLTLIGTGPETSGTTNP